MKKAQGLISLVFLFATTKDALPYTIDFLGASYYGTTAIPGYARHFDVKELRNDPESGPYIWDMYGNSQQLASPSFSIVPEMGDAPSGSLEIRLSYSLSENLIQDFANFTATPFATNYAASLTLRQISSGRESVFPVFGPATISVGLDIGEAYELVGIIDAAGVHEHLANWTPDVVDPAQWGMARLSISSTLDNYSIQVIPEPRSFLLLVAGLPLMSFVILRRRR
jgi:hypothetical protein